MEDGHSKTQALLILMVLVFFPLTYCAEKAQRNLERDQIIRAFESQCQTVWNPDVKKCERCTE